MVAAFDQAVFVRPSRDDAGQAIAILAQCMDAVSTASSKGEMNFGFSEAINQYWELHTVFRESRYRDESL